MLATALGSSVLGNVSPEKEVIRAGERAIRASQDF